MNSLVVFFAVLACAFAQYRPQPNYQPQSGGKVIAIVKQFSDVGPDGSYQWNFETENGISAQEQGALKAIGNEAGTVAQGAFSYTGPDGVRIATQYVADENGFQPQGDHLPKAPEVPEYILRSLAWNAAHPQRDEPLNKQRPY